MNKVVVIAFCAGLIVLVPASVKWFGESGIGCEPLDQACLLDYALSDMQTMVDDASTNNYGEALGKLLPYVDDATYQSLVDTYSESHKGTDLNPYVVAAVAQTPVSSGAVQQLSDLIDDPSLAGFLPLPYWGSTLIDAALQEDPAATADMAIAKGEAFSQTVFDGLYRVIAWMARNDLARLKVYLAAHDPQRASYFWPSSHLFRVAAELCEDGQDGKPLRDIALADFLRTPITITELYAAPMRAVVACDGLSAASSNLDEMFVGASKDIERQKARGRDGAFMIGRLVNAVNNDGLAPVIRKLHADGQTVEAEALASRLLPEAQVIISIDGNSELSIEKSQVTPRLAQILTETDEVSSNLDPVTMLRWFTTSFAPETYRSPSDYAGFAIDPILRLWPDPLAQKASDIALPLLASSEFKTAKELRLRTGIAIAEAATCKPSEATLEELLDQIAGQKKATSRVLAVADYLRYLARHDDAQPVCGN